MREDPPRVPSSVIYVAGSKELGGSRNVHRFLPKRDTNVTINYCLDPCTVETVPSQLGLG